MYVVYIKCDSLLFKTQAKYIYIKFLAQECTDFILKQFLAEIDQLLEMSYNF